MVTVEFENLINVSEHQRDAYNEVMDDFGGRNKALWYKTSIYD